MSMKSKLPVGKLRLIQELSCIKLKKTFSILIITLTGCLNSKYGKFDKIDMTIVDSIIIKRISKQDHHSIIQEIKLNNTQTKHHIEDINNMQDGTPWKFIPDYLIDFNFKDSIQLFRGLGGKIKVKDHLTLDLINEDYLTKLFKSL
mgnify:CR=1 FL=1